MKKTYNVTLIDGYEYHEFTNFKIKKNGDKTTNDHELTRQLFSNIYKI